MQRRKFIQNAAFTSVVTHLFTSKKAVAANAHLPNSHDKKGFTVLFQGDSITDGNRTRNNDWNHVMGHGFAYIAASRLWCDFPERNLHFFNRGVSGNKITDLAARWQTDAVDLQPDVISILVGINDIAAYINGNKDFSADNYEKNYRELLEKTKQALPHVQLILCNPFMLPLGRVIDNLTQYQTELSLRSSIVEKLSIEFDAIHIPFQTIFDKAIEKIAANYWIWDGIHPMPAGHELMAREWLHVVGKKVPQLSYGT
jgi:lysophospholipase L1-like esterase